MNIKLLHVAETSQKISFMSHVGGMSLVRKTFFTLSYVLLWWRVSREPKMMVNQTMCGDCETTDTIKRPFQSI
jgi:hypothetical protein